MKISYLKEYIYEFRRGFSYAAAYLAAPCICDLVFLGKWNILPSVPILFAMLSGMSHDLKLPELYYALPLTDDERWGYLQKMCCVKTFVPVAFALLWNLVLVMARCTGLYQLTLQMMTVAIYSFLVSNLFGNRPCGFGKKKRQALYGFDWTVAVLADIYASIMFAVCSMEISTVEFSVSLGCIFLLFTPMLVWTALNREKIQRQYISYEPLKRK